ncbi:cysteine-rich receptor-like protein kinase 44 [Silene latifolia]|uniref:cysteine-rich receptor-like protein kinase 44 n=1 Tax=Silene latifolia TaxID=37657 RepID=UPI003D787E99
MEVMVMNANEGDVNGGVRQWWSINGVECRFGNTEGFGDTKFVQYDFSTLKSATRDFSAETRLGEGGFGTVYNGTLENGEQLAIKRLSKSTSEQGSNEFMAEASLLAKLRHRNLVKLLGFCLEGDEKLLVYEFMSNGSLDRFLFDPNKSHLLDWILRYKIIKGIARGLQYLHEDSPLTIIHRDLKPGNILLDTEMNAKIADFGLAKLFDGAQKFGSTKHICGTIGYMAPEYMTTGEYSDKSDVYSFGIMLLEILSGQNNVRFYELLQKKDLPVHAWRLWNQKRSLELTDPILHNKCSSDEVIRCVQIGLLCLQANAEERPTMAKVAVMLTSSDDLPLPSTPAMSFPQFNMPVDFALGSTPAMSFPQFNMPMAYSGDQQSDTDQFSVMSVTQDMDPTPR